MERIFKRKLYTRLLEWKENRNGKTAILIEGARRVGKSTLAETFARNEYESYVLIDFNKASKTIKALFPDFDYASPLRSYAHARASTSDFTALCWADV